ncbi:hypothetical protein JQU17_09040 [Ponticoccus sp. SC2-23]|uniref:hypothetical protein n=1 Tax=Alexandriicola marinus TaxID=2081710 RepID=UPI000FD99907|nr:hypothetical protein [Alexandriicola marinus]MBM1220169.1 hypothetical protein [Ponticoccus sp. SC6-9]MBM1224855.1 hypothetical protein [Ponticoccus sp. SC6-15]MBM1228369.1 hypothetical protein [Ponticoccus sp. SC6-38]MBM1233994.1 hypothetical protein [Ponticoccus sp. SC6-45]MBM1238870.1 hypothetical protein [Ponticoccus sp. SC6-49]MBM1242652.1 hypothetical protein [Ponticoccus sp. SC2-64]MBM1247518.1 hypothetical protein [Ponticoccus sp. SC6-42]MBM1251823.1 hypothetical protein [Pontico
MSIKILTAAAALAASTATIASADVNYFSVVTDLDSANTLELGTVRAEADGTVEVYDFRAGEQRDLLGSTEVFAGANRDVRVEVPVAPMFDVLAVLKVNGEVVDMQVIDINS